MLDHAAVTRLLDELHDRQVLSVYLQADEGDPAERQAWRLRLARMLDDARPGTEGGAEARTDVRAFDEARALLEAELSDVKGFLPGPGWLAFATADAVHFSGPVAATVPDLVRWRQGPVLGPALRALKQERPVVLALVDSRRARLFRYVAARLSEVVDLRADTYIDDLTDRGTSKRAATASGMRGTTGTDEAARILQRETSRLLADVATRLPELAGDDGAVLLAGPAEARTALRSLVAMPEHRVADDVALAVTASDAEVRDAIERHASALSAQRQRTFLAEVIDAARAGGRGALGLAATRQAVEQGQVDRLLVSADFARLREDEVEPLLARCVALGGHVEGVTGEAAGLLGQDGIAARLRYAAVALPTE